MKVSVIIPVYNVEKYLRRCLDSVVNQNFNDYEVIIVNDGSTDNSLSIAEEYKKNYPDLVNVISQENKGLGAARNSGIDVATGEYLLFVDSDDYIDESLLADTYRVAKKFDSEIVVFDIMYVNEDGEEIKYSSARFNNCSEVHFDDKSVATIWPSAWNKLFKSSLFKDNSIYFPTGIWFEDFAIVPALLMIAKNIQYIPTAFYYYVQRDESIMHSSKIKRNKEIITSYENLLNLISNLELEENYSEELGFLSLYHVLYTATMRINEADYKNELQSELVDYVVSRYSNFENNKYYKLLLTSRERFVISLIKKKRFKLMHLLFVSNRKLRKVI